MAPNPSELFPRQQPYRVTTADALSPLSALPVGFWGSSREGGIPWSAQCRARDLRALLHLRVRCARAVFPPRKRPMLPWAFPCEGSGPRQPTALPTPARAEARRCLLAVGVVRQPAGQSRRRSGKPKHGVRGSPWPDRLPSGKADLALGPDRATPLPEEVRSFSALRGACQGCVEATSGDRAADWKGPVSRFRRLSRCHCPETSAVFESVEPESPA